MDRRDKKRSKPTGHNIFMIFTQQIYTYILVAAKHSVLFFSLFCDQMCTSEASLTQTVARSALN